MAEALGKWRDSASTPSSAADCTVVGYVSYKRESARSFPYVEHASGPPVSPSCLASRVCCPPVIIVLCLPVPPSPDGCIGCALPPPSCLLLEPVQSLSCSVAHSTTPNKTNTRTPRKVGTITYQTLIDTSLPRAANTVRLLLHIS